MIKGIHHVALRCRDMQNYRETLEFYQDVIGMRIVRSWGMDPDEAMMLELNGTFIEVFSRGLASGETGAINHFAFLTDDPDACVRKIRAAGYQVVVKPTDVDLWLTEPRGAVFPVRFAYCIGPVGETIEFYCERVGL